MTTETLPLGLVLAGGLARRMGGGDKARITIGGKTILERVLARLRPQCPRIILNANGDPARFAPFGLPVVGDVIGGFTGPLAGVLTGMEWTRAHRPDCSWIATIATDTPFFPSDLVERLLAAVENDRADLACAASTGRAHPVFGLWPVRLAADLRGAMVDEEMRKVDVWTARHRVAQVPFAADPVDPFFNTNRPEDLAEAERLLRARPVP
jgi:molybdenum cofactor guanylyltransferase